MQAFTSTAHMYYIGVDGSLSFVHTNTHTNIKDAFPSGCQDICCWDTRRLDMMFTAGKQTGHSWTCVCMCVWTVGSLIIFAFSPSISSIHFLIRSVICCVRVLPPLSPSSLLFMLSLFCHLSCRFNILLLPPSLPPCSQWRVRKVNFPTPSLFVFCLSPHCPSILSSSGSNRG